MSPQPFWTEDPSAQLSGSAACRLGSRLQEFEKGGVGEDRQKRGDESGVVNFSRDEARTHRDLGENKGKFPNLRQSDADALGSVPTVAEGADDAAPNKEFSRNDHGYKDCDELPRREPGFGVNQHTDGYEE